MGGTPPAEVPATSADRATPGFDLGTVQLPEECTEPPYEGIPPPGWFEPCSDFSFSADGRYLGFFFGPETCGRGIYVLDTQAGEAVYGTDLGGGHRFEFMVNGKVLLGIGHCEGGSMYLLDPETGNAGRCAGSGHRGRAALRTPGIAHRFGQTAPALEGLPGAVRPASRAVSRVDLA